MLTDVPSPPPTEDAVVVDGLSRSFGAVRAVDELSFSVRRGTFFALLGPNGAGKTTTIEICEGFTTAQSGTVRVLGHDPAREADALRPRLGVMLQAGGAHGGARVREALDLVARCARHPHDVDALLDLVGLSASARTPVRRLSGGQVQRLSLAMALVGRPELLFLDEPTAGMDPQARHLVWDLLRAARNDGVTTVLTTHLLDEVEVLADDVLIIDHGRKVAQGSPAALTGSDTRVTFRAPADLDTDALARSLDPTTQVCETSPGHYVVSGTVPDNAAALITAFLDRTGVSLHSLQVGTRTLDEVYLELTGREVRT